MYNFGFPEVGLLIGLIVVFVFELMMLVNVWRSSIITGKKILWTVLMFACNPLAAIIYFFGFRQKSSSSSILSA